MIPILLLIARSKLVADFALTIHFLHLLVTSLYTRALPTNLYWWGVQICSAGLMISLGVWACQWRELKPIAFGGRGKNRAESGEGLLEGGSGGERVDGRSYEMAGMASKGPV